MLDEPTIEAVNAMKIDFNAVGSHEFDEGQTNSPSRESTMGKLIADAQLAATAPAGKGAARIAFMNPGGVRADLVTAANGDVTYGQPFSVQPFGNRLVVKTMTGAQLRALLEQQFNSGTNAVAAPRVLLPSNDSSMPTTSRPRRVRASRTWRSMACRWAMRPPTASR